MDKYYLINNGIVVNHLIGNIPLEENQILVNQTSSNIPMSIGDYYDSGTNTFTKKPQVHLSVDSNLYDPELTYDYIIYTGSHSVTLDIYTSEEISDVKEEYLSSPNLSISNFSYNSSTKESTFDIEATSEVVNTTTGSINISLNLDLSQISSSLGLTPVPPRYNLGYTNSPQIYN